MAGLLAQGFYKRVVPSHPEVSEQWLLNLCFLIDSAVIPVTHYSCGAAPEFLPDWGQVTGFPILSADAEHH